MPLVRINKEVQLNTQIDNKSIEIQYHTLKEQVCSVYFGIVILQETQAQIVALENTLKAQLVVVESAVQNGVMLSVERDKLKAGIAKAQQQLYELQSKRKSAIDVLSELTGMQIAPAATFNISESDVIAGDSPRIEL